MEEVVSASEARVHLGALLRSVVEEGKTVIIERSGRPQVVMLDLQRYRQLQTGSAGPRWQPVLDRIVAFAQRVEPVFLSPADIIREGREDRDGELGLP